MGYEKSVPRNGIILVVAVATIVTLGGLHFAFTSYFNDQVFAEMQAKVYGVQGGGRDAIEADAAKRLAAGEMTMKDAMEKVAQGERAMAVDPGVADFASVEGWNGLADKAAPCRMRAAEANHRLAVVAGSLKAAAQSEDATVRAGLEQLKADEARAQDELDAIMTECGDVLEADAAAKAVAEEPSETTEEAGADSETADSEEAAAPEETAAEASE